MRRGIALFLLLGLGMAQNYFIDLSPTPVSVAPGKGARATLAVLPENFTGTLPVVITGLPQGVSYSPTSITVADPRKNATVEVVFTAAANTPTTSSMATLKVGEKTYLFSVVVDPAAEPPSQNPASLEAIWSQVQQWGSTACTTINSFSLESVRWVCTLYRTLDRAVGMWDEVKMDFEMLKKEGFVTGVSYIANALGAELGLAQANVQTDQLERDFLSLRRNYRALVAKVTNWMAQVREKQVQAIRENPYPNGSPSWWAVEALKLNPNLLLAEIKTQEAATQLATTRVRVEAASAAAEAQIEQANQDRAQEELQDALQVTNPLPGQEGEAEQVVRRAKEANSTREVLEVLVDAQAKIMRQNLANSQNVVTAVRQTAVQQAYTTQQLANLMELEMQRRADEIRGWKAEVEREMARMSEEAESQTANLRMLATLSRTVACPDGVLGPGQDGNITCIRP